MQTYPIRKFKQNGKSLLGKKYKQPFVYRCVFFTTSKQNTITF